jgi:predicted ArsR family transcriptional regulator
VKNIPVTRSQQAVLTALRAQPDLVDIEALAQHLGRHPNTLREHLVGLLDAGLIVRYAAPPDGRGRPRWLYRTAEVEEVDENAELAASLAWQLARRSRDPLSAARQVSRRWARQIAERYRMIRQSSARAARAQVVEVIDGLGYEPVPDRALDRVALMRCPLLQVAKDVPEVVCNVHLGLVEELVEISGGDRTRVTLTPFSAPGRCDLRLMAPPTDEVRRAAVPSH